MVFGIDDLIIMGVAIAARQGYVKYQEKKRERRPLPTTSNAVSLTPCPVPALKTSRPTTQPRTKNDIYRLLPITGDETRVLTLKGDTDEIVIEMTKLDLDKEEFDYVALSYFWGESSHNRQIIVNGINWDVTDNLYEALLSIKRKSSGEEAPIWIDQICIDQSSEREQKDHVNLMSKVYGQADGVIVWMGKANDASERVLKHFEACAENGCEDNEYFTGYAPDERGVMSLHDPVSDFGIGIIDRPWWRRVWVIQEVMLNSDVALMCGERVFDFDSIVSLAAFAARHNLPTLRPDRPPKHVNAEKDNFRLPMSILEEMRNRLTAGDKIDFPEWLEVFHTQDSSIPRDKLYGLYGLADREQYQNLPVDYEHLSDRTVFTQAAQAIIQGSGKLDFICLGGRQTRSPKWPTWVPDLRTRPSYLYSYWPLNYMSVPAFKASNRGHSCHWGADPQILGTWGYEVDEIADIGPENKTQAEIINGHLGMPSFVSAAIKMASRVKNPQSPSPIATFKTVVCDMGEAGIRLGPTQNYCDMPLPNVQSPHFQPDSHQSNASPSAKKRYMEAWQAMTKLRFSRERRFFTTKQGRLGVGPAEMSAGDLVCILDGASVPYILHFERSRHPRKLCTFLGECYVHGIMDGEAMSMGLERTLFGLI